MAFQDIVLYDRPAGGSDLNVNIKAGGITTKYHFSTYTGLFQPLTLCHELDHKS